MPTMTKADKLRRTESRLTAEGKHVAEALERLDGCADRRMISIRNSYVFTQMKIDEYIYDVRRELAREDT